jgi:hypothetical protein
MADHDDSTSSLGCTETSAVHHPVGPPIPDVFQTTDDCCHVSSLVTGEKPLGVLDDDPPGSGVVDESEVLLEEPVELPEKSRASASKPCSMRCSDGRVLAGEPAADEFGTVERCACDIADVSFQRNVGVVPRQDGPAVRVDLDHELVLPAQPVEALLEPADPGERGHVRER